MKLIKLSITLLFLLTRPPLMAQTPVLSPGDLQSVVIGGQAISFRTAQAFGDLIVYTPSVIRVRLDKKPLGRDFSYAVVGKPETTRAIVTQNDDSILLVTDSIRAVIYKKPFRIAFYTPGGELINQDEPGLSSSWVGEEATCYKTMMPGEHFVGLGEKTGALDRKGCSYTNWNSDNYGYSVEQDPLYSTIPFYIGIHHALNYGIFLDNSFQSDFNFGASNNRFASFGARGGELNYYFIYHKRVAGIIASYTWLTGRMKIPPLWSLGYQQNRYSYYPDTEVMRIAQTLREKQIPCDGITLDIHYMDQFQLFTWNRQRFPDPQGMARKLNALGFKLTVIVDPGIKVQKGAVAYESGARDSVYIKYPDKTFYTGQVWPGWSNFADFTSEKGRAWWRKQMKFFSDNGVSGIWNDMNEISTWGQKMPSNVLFDFDGAETSHLQAHNVYGLEMARSSYEGARESFTERPFILSRAGFAGLQRYAAIWTGDNRAEDDHMLLGLRLIGSLGLSGVSFSGMDIGGFTGGANSALYTRWMQIGAFIPYFRNHTGFNTKSSEPWTYGEDALDVSRNYIDLRYKLLPYLYSTFYESTQNGMPVLRSLAINYTFDPRIFKPEYQNQYMFGQALLVAPFESTKEFGKIYFPEGNWYNLYNDEKYQGKQEIIQPITICQLPVFVKEGSIIPMQSLVQSTADAPTDTLLLHVYNGVKPNEFIYYEDDGRSFNYEKNDFYKRSISFNPAAREFILGGVTGSYKSKFHHIKLIMHAFGHINQVRVDGRAVNGVAKIYKMIPSSSAIDVTADAGNDKGAAAVYEVIFDSKDQKQIIDFESNE